jgi:hypothetical protein
MPLHAALAYWYDHQDEINAALAARDRQVKPPAEVQR